MSYSHYESDQLTLQVLAQANASKSHFAEVIDDRIKVRIAAPAVDGAANKALVQFIAKAFGVAKRDVTISKGETSRRKTIVIQSPQKQPLP